MVPLLPDEAVMENEFEEFALNDALIEWFDWIF